MIQAIYCYLLLTFAATFASSASVAPLDVEKSRLAGIYVKDGNENGQLRFLAAGLTGTGNNNNGLNAALNQYINNKQDMLEQLRPTSTNTGTGFGTGTGTGLGNSNAIYVSLGGGGGTGTATGTTGTGGTGTGTGTGTSNAQAALNQAIYASPPINQLLPQIVGQAVAQRQGVAGGNIRRGQVQRRRVVVNGNRRRRKGNKGKKGSKRPQVVVLRPNRG